MARGRPSSLRTICAIAAAFSSSRANPGTAAAARSANRRTDSQAATEAAVGLASSRGTASGGTGHSCSPETCSDERLLTRIRRALVCCSSRVTTGAPASRCSKLSRTSRSRRSRSWLTRCSIKGPVPGVLQPDALRDRRPHQPGISHRRQRDEVDAVRVVAGHLRGQRDAQPGLAAAARPGQRDQVAARQQPFRLPQLAFPADEAGERLRQADPGGSTARDVRHSRPAPALRWWSRPEGAVSDAPDTSRAAPFPAGPPLASPTRL